MATVEYTPLVMPEVRYALTRWRADGIYKAADAVKLYKVRGAAENAAMRAYDNGNERNLVVRTVFISAAATA